MASKKEPIKVVVHIFRHGERPLESVTAGNLTERGRAHAVAIGRRLAREMGTTKIAKAVKFYSSPVGRNMEFMDLIRSSLLVDTVEKKVPVKVLASKIREKFKYGKVLNKARYDAEYNGLPLEEFNRLWIQGKTDPAVVEQPAQVLTRIRRDAEEYAARLSHAHRGKPLEIHIAIVTHGDLMGMLRQRVTRRQAMLGRQKTNFGEEIKLTLRGRRGTYQTRGVRRKVVVRRAKR